LGRRVFSILIVVFFLTTGCSQNSVSTPIKNARPQINKSNLIQTKPGQLLPENLQNEFKEIQTPLTSDQYLIQCHRLRTDLVMIEETSRSGRTLQLDDLENLREKAGRAYVSTEAVMKIRLSDEERDLFATAFDVIDETMLPLKKWKQDYLDVNPSDENARRMDVVLPQIAMLRLSGRVLPAVKAGIEAYKKECLPHQEFVDTLSAVNADEVRLSFSSQDPKYIPDLNARPLKVTSFFGAGRSRQDYGLVVAPDQTALGVYVIKYNFHEWGIHWLDFALLKEDNRAFASASFDVYKFQLGQGYVTLFLSRQSALKSAWVFRDQKDKEILKKHTAQISVLFK
jgi:hypothetical protein